MIFHATHRELRHLDARQSRPGRRTHWQDQTRSAEGLQSPQAAFQHQARGVEVRTGAREAGASPAVAGTPSGTRQSAGRGAQDGKP